MQDRDDSFGAKVIDAVMEAFRDGAGETKISAEAEKEIRAYWQGRWDKVWKDVQENWARKEKDVIAKVKKMGKLAADETKGQEDGSSIELKDFLAAKSTANSFENGDYSPWC